MGIPLRLLLIEDSADDAELILRVLRQGAFEPSAVRVETEEALRAALAHGGWEVVLVDFALPQLDGLAALRLTKQTDPDLPLLIVSGTLGDEKAVEAMKTGAEDYIPKRNLERLPGAVERALHQAAVRRDRQRAEKALVQLADIVEASGFAVVAQTLGGTIVSWNPAAERLFGWSAREAIGHPVDMLLPAGRAAEFAALQTRLRQEERIGPFETVRLRKDGRSVLVMAAFSLLQDADGRTVGISFIAREAPTAPRTYLATSAVEEHFRLIAESISTPAWIARPEGAVEYLNACGQQYVGQSGADASAWDWQHALHPDDLPHVQAILRSVRSAREPLEFEYRVRRADGTYRWHSGCVVALRDEAGHVFRLFGTSAEIDDRQEEPAPNHEVSLRG